MLLPYLKYFETLRPNKEVEITAIGNKRIITPADQSWDEWFDAPGVSSDFMTNRCRPEDKIREIAG